MKMIAKIEGLLESIEEGAALVRLASSEGSGLTYHVLLSAFTATRLQGVIGSQVSLHTLQFIESLSQGANLVPRLAGFLTVEDRRFYELFVTCKGIGHRRALRSMTMDTGQIAAAIADRDVAMLQSLPEIGRRTAETIVATLRGKVESYVAVSTYATTAPDGTTVDAGTLGGNGQVATPLGRQGLEVLLKLGENRTQAIAWIDHVMSTCEDDKRPTDVQELIELVYQVKSGL